MLDTSRLNRYKEQLSWLRMVLEHVQNHETDKAEFMIQEEIMAMNEDVERESQKIRSQWNAVIELIAEHPRVVKRLGEIVTKGE